MVRIDRVVTRGGDGGQTSLGDGTRVPKDALRVDTYGTVDEANALIGLLRAHAAAEAAAEPGFGTATDAALGRVQNDLFDLGADLCVPGAAGERLRMTDAPSAALETEIAGLNAGLAPLTSFVLPGGSLASCHAHVARTVVRRAERLAVALAAAEPVNPAVVRYLNRLSDYLFVLARALNARAGGDVEWVPGANR